MRKTTAKAILIFLCTIICLFPAAIQADGTEWSNLSPAALPEDHMLTDDGFTLNVSGGIPYVLTNKAMATARSMRIYKGENGYWPAIGEALPLSINESFISSDVYDHQVYIAYISRGTAGYVPVVKKLDNASGSWSTVGDLSSIQLRDISGYDNITIKLHNGIPYIAFIASPASIKVMRYEGGSWVSVAQALTENGYFINNVKLQFDGDVPYVAWKKLRYQYSFQQINIARYQNGQWSVLPNNGGNTITTVAETDLDFCFDNGNIYLAYQDNTLNRNPQINYEQTYVAPNRANSSMFNSVVVWRHNGTKWEKLPDTPVRCFLGYNCCIEAKNGRLYAASNGGGVWEYDSQTGKWTNLASISSGMWTVDIKCEGDRLYLAFGSHDQKVIVRSLDLLQQPSIVPGAANTSEPAAPTAPADTATGTSTGTASGTAPQAQNTPDWDGVWSTKNGTMMLQQSGSNVWGIYGTNENDSFTFKGTANGSKLTGTFEDGSGKGSGTFEFTLGKDGSFAGRYKYNGALDWITISGTGI
ncbi:MAG: hypothetical protein ACM3ZR_12145 [Pseudomonadota bacterium]